MWNELALQTTHGDSYTDLIRLFKIREVLGPVFGSEDLCILLYSLIRREVPRTLVELGTGLGVSALWMAQAVKENGVGHVYTLDDGRDFDQSLDCLAKVDELLTPELHPMTKGGIEEHLARFSTACGLTEHLTFRRATFGDDGDDLLAPESCYFGDGTIDLLLADFAHDPESIMNILAFFLPRMSDCSSIFIDGASTHLSSYLVLERIVEQLNRSKMPARFLEVKSKDQRWELFQIVSQRTFRLIHLVERRERAQNSTAWIRIEPTDWKPHPPSKLH